MAGKRFWGMTENKGETWLQSCKASQVFLGSPASGTRGARESFMKRVHASFTTQERLPWKA